MEQIMNFIKPELVVLIPVLYFAGMGIKKSAAVPDKYIPLILGGVGVALSVVWVLATSAAAGVQGAMMAVFTAVTQGVLCAGCSVYINQIGKQSGKDE